MSGYCHFNEGDGNKSFTIDVFGQTICIFQNPASRDLGHGAVVWDASVVFAKYMEQNSKEFDVKKLKAKRVLELGKIRICIEHIHLYLAGVPARLTLCNCEQDLDAD